MCVTAFEGISAKFKIEVIPSPYRVATRTPKSKIAPTIVFKKKLETNGWMDVKINCLINMEFVAIVAIY